MAEQAFTSHGVQVTTLSEWHHGHITGLDTSPFGHLAVTCDSDGTVVCWDYAGRRRLYGSSFECPTVSVTSLAWVPPHIDPSGGTVVVEFSDRVLRVLRLDSGDKAATATATAAAAPSFVQVMVLKPHNTAVLAVSFSPTQSIT